MLGFLKRRIEKLFIDGGSVSCPVRGTDVEVDLCYACERCLEIDERAPMPFVRCEPPPRLSWGHRL
jgi:hypothetical protein